MPSSYLCLKERLKQKISVSIMGNGGEGMLSVSLLHNKVMTSLHSLLRENINIPFSPFFIVYTVLLLCKIFVFGDGA